ncbi:MAG: hypothetical protein NTX81_06920 [Candidatus Bathyarchaeota archaeon]|nr:hypothetical protein [Candidatus Bathyarchaeota archaeon]
MYSEVDVRGALVNCIYFVIDECRAQPFTERTERGLNYYKPDEEDRKNYCKTHDFKRCPRYVAYNEHIRALGLKKD